MSVLQLPSPQAAAQWLSARVGGVLWCDSRCVQPGDGFVAWPGYARDGRAFVPAALAAGATACLVESQGAEAFGFDDVRIAALAGLKATTGEVAHRFFGRPSERLAVVAVTGTNGKTSTAWWLAQALTLCGRRGAMMGTLGIGEPGHALQPSSLTTPDPVTVHAAMQRFEREGVVACVLEASSIGLVEHRLDALAIQVAVFTNFTQDHLDYHGDMVAYRAAKCGLFTWPGLRAAVVNVDDAHGVELAASLAGGASDLWTVSMCGPARLRASGVEQTASGLQFDLTEGDQCVTVQTAVVGDYNISNLLGVLGALRALGVPLAQAARAVPQLTPVPGRLQRVSQTVEPAVLVDYAHTPDALDKALRALRPLARSRGGALWCVFGCGGDRDPGKRPLMGAIAARQADHVVLTSDNPRSEAPALILAQVLAGIARSEQVDVFEDRAQAIQHAVARATAADVVLVAGKGHESHQEVAGIKRPFSDVQHALAALNARATPTALGSQAC